MKMKVINSLLLILKHLLYWNINSKLTIWILFPIPKLCHSRFELWLSTVSFISLHIINPLPLRSLHPFPQTFNVVYCFFFILKMCSLFLNAVAFRMWFFPPPTRAPSILLVFSYRILNFSSSIILVVSYLYIISVDIEKFSLHICS